MGIADDIGSLRQEITDADYQRQELISETKQYVSETRQTVSDLLTDFTKERQEMTAELRADLKKSVSELKDDSDSLIADYAKERQETTAELRANLKKSVSELRADSDSLIADYAKERQIMADELRADLKQSVSEIKDTSDSLVTDYAKERQEMAALLRAENTEFVTNLKNSTDTLLNDYSDERTAMRRAWRGEGQTIKVQELIVQSIPVVNENEPMPAIEAEPEVVAETIVQSIPESQVESGGNGDDKDQPELSVSDEMVELKTKMLDIVINSADGISLTEIGDKLGVEWRKLIRPARDLLENDQVQKVDVNYFPKETPGQEPETGDKKFSSGYF